MSLEEQIKKTNIITKKSIVTVGTFDGVHIGHQSLFQTLRRESKKSGANSIAIVFKEQPRAIIRKEQNKLYLTTFEERKKLISKYVDYIIPINFNESIQNLKSTQFIQILKKNINTIGIVSGDNAKIGCDQKLIKSIDKNLIKVINSKIKGNSGEIFSSSNIKKTIEFGKFEKTTEMLGRYYKISGKIVSGKKRGRLLGFPTANIKPSKELLIPCKGIFATIAMIKNTNFLSGTSIGYNPTFEKEKKISIETFIIDFNEDLYNQKISLSFISKIREEKKFESTEDLIKQMHSDISNIKKIKKSITK